MIWLPRVETGKTGKKSLSTYDITSQLSITVNRLYIVKVGLELYIYIYMYMSSLIHWIFPRNFS